MHRATSSMLTLLAFAASLLSGCQTAAPIPGISGPPKHAIPHYKATFVIVHGAWGGGWAFREVDAYLTADGYKVFRPTLTGQGEKVHLASPEVNLSTHINDIVNLLNFEDLHDVILVGHSYGGMVVTGVADRVPQRIGRLVYVDAIVPENGESVDTVPMVNPLPRKNVDGFYVPTWKVSADPPHDVPMSAKTFSEPITLANAAATAKIPTTYILTVDPGKKPQEDTFYHFYERAQKRWWTAEIMEGDHNVQWSRPAELVRLLENVK